MGGNGHDNLPSLHPPLITPLPLHPFILLDRCIFVSRMCQNNEPLPIQHHILSVYIHHFYIVFHSYSAHGTLILSAIHVTI